jgi:hypothetical protein
MLSAQSPPATARPVASPLTRSPTKFGALHPYPLAPAPSHPVTPSPEPSRRHHCVPSSPPRQASPVLATSPPPPRSPIKGPPELPQLLTPASASPNPSPELNRATPPRPSSAPVSSSLPSLVAYGQIAQALKLCQCATSLSRTSPSPIAPGSPTGDLTVVGARHPAVDPPSRALSSQIDPATMTPYPGPR